MRELFEEIRNLQVDAPRVRSFSRVVGGALILLGLVVLWRRAWTATPAVWWLAGSGVALALIGLVAPSILRPAYRIWMGLALVLGYFMSYVILSLVYFLTILPAGLVFRLRGKDLLDRRPDPAVSSYWRKKEYLDTSRNRLEKYY